MEKDNLAIGCGIASFIFSILSILLIKFIIVSIILAVAALVLGAFSRKSSFGKAGIIIGAISIFTTFALFILLEVLDISSLFMVPEWYK